MSTAAAETKTAETPVAETAAPQESRLTQAGKVVRNYSLGNIAMGAIPLPLVDLAGITAVQLKMLHSLSKLYDIPFSKELAKSAVSSLLGSSLPMHFAGPASASLAKFIPFIGQGLAYATLPVFSGASTYAVGKVFVQHFESGGTFLTFDPEKVRAYFEEQMKEGQNVAKDMSEKVAA